MIAWILTWFLHTYSAIAVWTDGAIRRCSNVALRINLIQQTNVAFYCPEAEYGGGVWVNKLSSKRKRIFLEIVPSELRLCLLQNTEFYCVHQNSLHVAGAGFALRPKAEVQEVLLEDDCLLLHYHALLLNRICARYFSREMPPRHVRETTTATFTYAKCELLFRRWMLRVRLKGKHVRYRSVPVRVGNRRGPGCSPLQCLLILLVQHLNSDLC